MTAIYLDSPSTTCIDPSVVEVMMPLLHTDFGNPHSDHEHSLAPSSAVDRSLQQVASLLNADPGEIVFTSGATEANNTALKGVMTSADRRGNHVVVSAIEHKCILEAAAALRDTGVELSIVPPEPTGIVSASAVMAAIRPDTAMVSLMLLNNETGILQPVREVAEVARRQGVVMHTDAAQYAGKRPLDVRALGVDLLSLSGHKFYGPKGIGALFISHDCPAALIPLIHGGGQQASRRGGTVPPFLCAGLGAAAELAEQQQVEWEERSDLAAQAFESKLFSLVRDVERIGDPDAGTSICVNYRFPRADADLVLQTLFGRVSASLGSACRTGSIEPSHVLTAMRLTPAAASECIRFGFDKNIGVGEATNAAELVAEAVQSARAASAA